MIQTPNFFVGQTIAIKGAKHVIGSINGEQVHLYYKRGGTPRKTTLVELHRLLEEGKVMLPPDEQGRPAAPVAAVLPDLPEDEQMVISMRLQFIRGVTGQPLGVSMARLPVEQTEQCLAVVASQLGTKVPSYATFARWLRSYLESEGDPMSLLPAVSRRGNRSERFTPDVRRLIDEAIDEWLQQNRPTAKFVYGSLAGKIVEINALRDSDNRVPLPDYRTLVRMLKKLDPIVVITKRHGKDAGERAMRSRAGGPIVRLPLERVEIDHTPLDLTVVDEEGNILGRPTLTVALDKLSRAIVGFYVSFTPPSFLSVAQCLRHVLTNKSYLRTRHQKIQNDWLAHGVPLVIVTDNGKEFIGTNFKLSCEQLGVSVQLCPPGKPWFKGSVERFLATLNEGLIHNLPGTTKSNPQDRGDYDPAKHATISLHNLDYLLCRWIVDVYMQSPHSEIGTSPAAAWRRAVELNPPRMLKGEVNLDVVLGMVYERRINNGRVQVENLPYHSPALTVLRARLKPSQKVQVKLNPDDLGKVHVLNSLTQEYLEAECVRPDYAKGLTLHAHKNLLRRLRIQREVDIDFDRLYLAKLELAREIKKALGKRGKKTRKDAARGEEWANRALKYAEADGASTNLATRTIDLAPDPSAIPRLAASDSPDDLDGWGFEYINNNHNQEPT